MNSGRAFWHRAFLSVLLAGLLAFGGPVSACGPMSSPDDGAAAAHGAPSHAEWPQAFDDGDPEPCGEPVMCDAFCASGCGVFLVTLAPDAAIAGTSAAESGQLPIISSIAAELTSPPPRLRA